MSAIVDHLKRIYEQRKNNFVALNAQQGTEIMSAGTGISPRRMERNHLQVRNLYRNFTKNARKYAEGLIALPSGDLKRLPSIKYYFDPNSSRHVFPNNPELTGVVNNIAPIIRGVIQAGKPFGTDGSIGCLRIAPQFASQLPTMAGIVRRMKRVDRTSVVTDTPEEIGQRKRNVINEQSMRFINKINSNPGISLFEQCPQIETGCHSCDVCAEHVARLKEAWAGITATSADPDESKLLDAARPIHICDAISILNNMDDHARGRGTDIESCNDLNYIHCGRAHSLLSSASMLAGERLTHAGEVDLENTEATNKRGGFIHHDIIEGMPTADIGAMRGNTNYQAGEEPV